jgi:hypothetical protein
MTTTSSKIRSPHQPRSAAALAPAAAVLLLAALVPAVPALVRAAADDEPAAAASWSDDPAFEAAQRGLDYLVKRQNPDGSWDGDIGFKLNQDYEVERNSRPHVGVTALAGIAFLAGGHLPERGKYGRTVSQCIDFLLSCVNDEGYITKNGTRMYSHAFATLFLAEVYGMTRRADVERKLQEAVTLIVKCQNKMGSWRYKPFAPESDMSVTVCQLMALRAARNVGIKVPKSTIDRAVLYVRRSRVSDDDLRGLRFSNYERYYRVDRGAFYYQIYNNGSMTGLRSSFSLTAAGIASLYNAGKYSDEELQESLQYLRETFDIVTEDYSAHYFFWYGHYYAVQAMYTAGEPHWGWYRDRIFRELLKMQRSDGHWDNFQGPGENFATAIAAIILQIHMGYLPIFER